MPVKAIALLEGINSTSSGTFDVNVIATLTNGNQQDVSFIVGHVAADLSQLLFEDAVKTETKTQLTAAYGTAWGLFDTVRVLGATL